MKYIFGYEIHDCGDKNQHVFAVVPKWKEIVSDVCVLQL